MSAETLLIRSTAPVNFRFSVADKDSMYLSSCGWWSAGLPMAERTFNSTTTPPRTISALPCPTHFPRYMIGQQTSARGVISRSPSSSSSAAW
eukprot:3934801-Rhodomonas_salina.1